MKLSKNLLIYGSTVSVPVFLHMLIALSMLIKELQNGIGMSAGVIALAFLPFFSSAAGLFTASLLFVAAKRVTASGRTVYAACVAAIWILLYSYLSIFACLYSTLECPQPLTFFNLIDFFELFQLATLSFPIMVVGLAVCSLLLGAAASIGIQALLRKYSITTTA
ncbi:MAG: hypothetical protein K2Z81_03920 [Cyanobacteria bacterium]|nr:hypothetical protein [Cyanobacteriota bacterium]